MSHAAIHAAQQAAEKARREEENQTGYSGIDIEKYEFKILRSSSSAFKKPQKLMQALEEEALSGWDLVEKFDDQRLRLMRKKSKREDDLMLSPGVNPYRTNFGISSDKVGALIAGSIIVVVLLFVLIAVMSGNM